VTTTIRDEMLITEATPLHVDRAAHCESTNGPVQFTLNTCSRSSIE
jgi:hypothetical protein